MEALNPVPSGREHWVTSPEAAAAEWVGGFQKNTRSGYGSTLRRWLTFCEASYLDPWAVSRIHIEAWLRTLPPKAAAGAATVVRGFYRDAHGRGLTPTDLAWGVRTPRRHRGPAGTWATADEVARMISESHADGEDAHALIVLLALTGARLSEVLRLEPEDIETIRDRRTVTYRRKNGYTDRVTVSAPVHAALQPLLDRRTTGRLLRWHGAPMRAHTARALVTTIADRAKCAQKITPHSLRRSFVTIARGLGVEDADIMAATGHRDPSMIEYYLRGPRELGGVAADALANRLIPPRDSL